MKLGLRLLQADIRNIIPIGVFSLVLAVVVFPVLGLIYYYNFSFTLNFSNYYFTIIFFTIFQSFASSFFSLLIGSVFALLLIRHRRHKTIKIIVNFLSILFVLPTILSVFGVLAFYGQYISIYGIIGILLGHTVLNAPLITRIIFQSLNDISSNEYMLAKQMSLDKLGIFFAIEWPIIKKNIPSLFVIVFFICFVSFTPVLILGGSPKYSTLEVAIYYSVIFNNDFNAALNLLLVQLSICLFIYAAFFKNFKSSNFIIDEQRNFYENKKRGLSFYIEIICIILISIFIISPICFIILNGFNKELINVFSSSYLWHAINNTFVICFFSGSISVIVALNYLNLIYRKKYFTEILIYSLIIFSPVVMAVGYYILLFKVSLFDIPNILIVIILNAIFSLPFTYNFLAPSYFKITHENEDISKSINMYGLQRFLIIDFPRLKVPIITAFSVSSILSASDLVIISFFGTNSLSTLTQTIYRLMGSYRMDEAYSVSLILLMFCICYFGTSYVFMKGKLWNTH